MSGAPCGAAMDIVVRSLLSVLVLAAPMSGAIAGSVMINGRAAGPYAG